MDFFFNLQNNPHSLHQNEGKQKKKKGFKKIKEYYLASMKGLKLEALRICKGKWQWPNFT